MTLTHNPQAAADQFSAAYRKTTDQLANLGLDTAVPEGVRAVAEKAVAQTREAYDRSWHAFDASLTTFERTFDAAGQGAAAFNRKIVDLARRNADASFDLATSLAGAKDLADMVQLQAAFWRKQFGVLTAQAEEVRTLSTKVTAVAAEPIKSHMERAVDGRAHWGSWLATQVLAPVEETKWTVATILKQKAGGVFTTTSDKSFLDITKLLAQHGIGCIVIVGDDDKVAGIISERDLMRAISQGGAEVLTEPVSDFMTKTVMTAGEADTIDQLMSEMTIRQFRHMPVVERDRLIGLVSFGDLVKIQIAKSEMETAATREYAGLGGWIKPREIFTMKQLQEHKPSRHSFIAGNIVRLRKRVPTRNAAPGPYKVVAQLPEQDGQFQYRVKSGCEPFYRTVPENELEW